MTDEILTPQPLFEVDVHLAFEEYLRANYWILWKKLNWFFILWGVLLLFSIPLFFIGTDQDWTFQIMLIGIPLFMLLNTYIQSKSLFKSHLALRDVLHYSFTNVGVDQSAATSSGHTDWANVRKVYENKRSFLVFISKAQMYLIPKSVFKSKEEIVNFRNMLRSMIGTRKKVLYLLAR